MELAFNVNNRLAGDGVCIAAKKMLAWGEKPPVILCIGSDLSVADSLGPIVGTLLREKLGFLNVFVYGCLAKPITAHEIKYISEFLRATHPNSKIIAVDAAVGKVGDVGLIKIANHGLKPGSGANKKLDKVGDISVMGIIAERQIINFSMFSNIRLNIIYKMANLIADGLSSYILDGLKNSKNDLKYTNSEFKKAII